MVRLLDEVRSRRWLLAPGVARAIRKKAGLTQARVAQELGVDRVTVTRWENGVRCPRGHLLIAYGHLMTSLRKEAEINGVRSVGDASPTAAI